MIESEGIKRISINFSPQSHAILKSIKARFGVSQIEAVNALVTSANLDDEKIQAALLAERKYNKQLRHQLSKKKAKIVNKLSGISDEELDKLLEGF